MEPLTLEQFLARNGPLWVPWEEGDWWVLRWIFGALACIGAWAVFRGAVSGDLQVFSEALLAVFGLVGFVVMRRISPRHGGVRLDETGLQIEPDGLRVPAADIERLRFVPRRSGGLSVVLRTTSENRALHPFRASASGQEVRFRVPMELIDAMA